MPSADIMQLPFTTREEILDWETRDLKKQSKNRQSLEQTVIGLRKSVSERGYLLEAELRKMAQWKSHFTPSQLDPNPPELTIFLCEVVCITSLMGARLRWL